MLYFKETTLTKDGRQMYIYQDVSLEQMQQEVQTMLLSMGYKHLGGGAFERGNRTMRLLFGAFCKYFKYKIQMDMADECVRVTISSDSTGASGGLIGVNQVKNESDRIKRAFETI